jgi:hypothetical protein
MTANRAARDMIIRRLFHGCRGGLWSPSFGKISSCPAQAYSTPQPWNPGYIQINPDVSGCRRIRIYPDTFGIYPVYPGYIWIYPVYIRMYSDTSKYIRIHPGCIRIHLGYIRIHPGYIYIRIHLDLSGYILDSKAGE